MRQAGPWRVLAGALVVAASGCGVAWDAPRVALIVVPGEIVYAEARGDEALVGGETVIEVANSTDRERQIVLAELPFGDLPDTIVDAETARDDDRIIGLSRRMDAEEASYAAGGFGKKTDKISFHIYLRPGTTYVVFDTLADGVDGVIRWFTPTEHGDAGSKGAP